MMLNAVLNIALRFFFFSEEIINPRKVNTD